MLTGEISVWDIVVVVAHFVDAYRSGAGHLVTLKLEFVGEAAPFLLLVAYINDSLYLKAFGTAAKRSARMVASKMVCPIEQSIKRAQ